MSHATRTPEIGAAPTLDRDRGVDAEPATVRPDTGPAIEIDPHTEYLIRVNGETWYLVDRFNEYLLRRGILAWLLGAKSDGQMTIGGRPARVIRPSTALDIVRKCSSAIREEAEVALERERLEQFQNSGRPGSRTGAPQ